MKALTATLAFGLLACERVVYAPWAEPYEALAIIEGVDPVEYPVAVEVPPNVRRGERFTVSVRTYVDGCDAKGRTQAENRETRARIVVYSLIGVSANCTITRVHEHTAEFKFDEAGAASVTVVGRSETRGIVENTYPVIVR